MKKVFIKTIIILGCITLSVFAFLKFNQVKVKEVISEKKCDRCNILLIDIDILRADALPCYGYQRNTAPNICNFANKSVLFEDNYSVSYWTLPDMFSTITSLYPTFHRIKNILVDKLSPEIPTLAETLKNAGYTTIFVGNPDISASIDTKNGGARGFEKYIDTKDQSIDNIILEASKSSKPWFIHYYRGDLHMPYLIPEGSLPIESTLTPPKGFPIKQAEYDILFNKYLKKNYTKVFKKAGVVKYGTIIFSAERPGDTSLANLFYDLGSNKEFQYIKDGWLPMYLSYMGSFDQSKKSDVAYVRMMYDSKLRVLDASLQHLFQLLEEDLKQKNITTIIMSNHGEAFGEHNKYSHDSDYHTELFATPLIIRSPGIKKTSVRQPSSNLDIFPTILDIIGLNKIETLQGLSLLSYINDQGKNARPFVFSESLEGIILQNRQWLYLLPYSADNVSQTILHNKINDPEEGVNVIDLYPELATTLFEQSRLLRSYGETVNSKPHYTTDFDINKLSPEKIERLKKEGYF